MNGEEGSNEGADEQSMPTTFPESPSKAESKEGEYVQLIPRDLRSSLRKVVKEKRN